MMTKNALLILGALLSAGGLVALPARAQSACSCSTLTTTGNATIGGVIAEPLSIDSDGEDVNLSVGTGVLIVGDNTANSPQIGIDTNEIQARAAGAPATLHLQHGGGVVAMGDEAEVATNLYVGENVVLYGLLSADNLPTDVGSDEVCYNGVFGLCPSSRRFKTDVVDLRWGLREVMAMKPVTFSWINGGGHDLGFIAEDALTIVPELVKRDEEGNVRSFNYRHYTAVLTRAIQEQQKSIEDDHRAISLRDQEIAELRSELTAQGSTLSSQASELEKLRDEVSALTRAVARLSGAQP